VSRRGNVGPTKTFSSEDNPPQDYRDGLKLHWPSHFTDAEHEEIRRQRIVGEPDTRSEGDKERDEWRAVILAENMKKALAANGVLDPTPDESDPAGGSPRTAPR